MSKIEQLIQEIEEYIDTCPFQPLSNKARVIVNKEELGELLVELRLRVPDEIKKYQKIISNQDAILSEARKQAASMLDEATAKSSNMIDEASERSNSMINEATAQFNQIMADADAQTRERVDNHEIMQQAYEQANQIYQQAQAEAQAIIDNAYAQAASIRLGAAQYTDTMLQDLQKIINHAISTSQTQFDVLQNQFNSLMDSFQSNYDIAESNRSELQKTMLREGGQIPEDEQIEGQEEQAAN